MRQVTATEIKTNLKEVFPNLYDIWITDQEYSVLNLEVLKAVLKDVSIKDMRYKNNIWDCDNFALLLHAMVQKYQYDLLELCLPKKHLSWAFGEAMGLKYQGVSKNHAVNICMTEQGLVFIEPQNDNIWPAVKDNDVIYFAKF